MERVFIRDLTNQGWTVLAPLGSQGRSSRMKNLTEVDVLDC
jgi:hypothetical protein